MCEEHKLIKKKKFILILSNREIYFIISTNEERKG